MSELTEVGGHPVLAEDYFRLGALPVMVCVLTFARDYLIIGFSLSKPNVFDDEIARFFARRNAEANAVKRLADRPPLARAAE